MTPFINIVKFLHTGLLDKDTDQLRSSINNGQDTIFVHVGDDECFLVFSRYEFREKPAYCYSFFRIHDTLFSDSGFFLKPNNHISKQCFLRMMDSIRVRF